MDDLNKELAIYYEVEGDEIVTERGQKFKILSRTKTTLTIEPCTEILCIKEYDISEEKELTTFIKDGKIITESA